MNRFKSSKVFIFISVVTLFANNCWAQKDFTIINYTSRNGLPQNSIKSLALDSLGFLWMTTESGLVRFDGRNFKVFNTSNTKELIADRTLGIYKTLSGELVMNNTFGSLYIINSNSLKVVLKGDVNTNIFFPINGMLPDVKFYAKFTDSDLSYLKKSDIYYSPVSVFPVSGNQYYLRTKLGIAIYNNLKKTKELKLDTFNIATFFTLNDHIYFITKRNSLYLVNKNLLSIQPCKIKGDLQQDTLFSVSTIDKVIGINNNSDNCIQLKNHLFEIIPSNDSTTLITKLVTNQLPLNCVINTIVYNKGKHFLAIGTDTKGLFIFKEKKIITLRYNQPEEHTNNAYYAQIALDSNTILSNWQREFTLNGVRRSKLTYSKFTQNAVFKDRDGNVWFQHNDTLLKHQYGNNQLKLTNIEKEDHAYTFFSEGDSIWTGTEKTISYIKNDTLKKYFLIKNQNLNTIPLSILRGMDKKLWFCNYTGVFRLNTSTNAIDTIAGVFNQFARVLYRINDMIFIGTYGSGYYIYYQDKLTKLPLDRNNYLSQVHSFIIDSNNYIWMTTNKGLFKTHLSEINKYVSDTTASVYYHYYGEENGIYNTEFNGGFNPPSLRLSNGYFSFPSMDGLVWLNPDSIFDIFPEETILIDQVEVDIKTYNIVSELHVPAYTENLKIYYSTPYWGDKNNLLLEYKLEGFNQNWIPLAVDEGSIKFSNLASGNYTLLIRKKAGFGNDNFIQNKFTFYVEKKFFETAWFKFLCLICATLFTIAVARLYAARIKKRNKLLEEKVQQRTLALGIANEQLQESVTAKDKLISIISHDIVTPLRFITMVARKGSTPSINSDPENMRLALDDIKNTSEKLHNNAQNILNWIKHQNKRITVNYTHVAVSALADDIAESLLEMASSKGTAIVNNISSEDIIKTDRNILSIILNNLLSNAIKFTLNGNIILDASQNKDFYEITVSDTGTGMTHEQLNQIQQNIKNKTVSVANPSSGGNGNGLGYLIISELMDMLHGKLDIESQSGIGTLVRLKIPVSKL